MLASTPAMGMTLPNMAFSLIMKSVQQAPTSPHPVSNDQGNRLATPLADSPKVHHVDVQA
ncbi:MAG: hypothetical protein QGG64_13010 [Candidatus Latescibacteria bacterium]|nr:hypothetical protein [Candidatus Latescibacterota bacterium]